MLIRQDKRFLKKLYKLINSAPKSINHSFMFWIDSENHEIYLFDTKLKFSYEPNEFHMLMQNLIDNNCIVRDKNRQFYFYLTYIGLHYFEFHRKEIFQLMFASVVLPIIVALVISVLTTTFSFYFSKKSVANEMSKDASADTITGINTE